LISPAPPPRCPGADACGPARRRHRTWVDGVGTGRCRRTGPSACALRACIAGCIRRWPLGLLLPRRWRRLHRKLCVVDGRVLFCGGINVLDDFHDPNHGRLRRRALTLAVQATARSWGWPAMPWNNCGGACRRRARRQPAPPAQALQAPAPPAAAHHAAPDADTSPGMRAALVLRDNVRHRSRIERPTAAPLRRRARKSSLPTPTSSYRRKLRVAWCWRHAGRAGAAAAAGALRILHAVPRGAPGVRRPAGRGRDPRIRAELSARQGGGDRRPAHGPGPPWARPTSTR
jgi:hypothetical protein